MVYTSFLETVKSCLQARLGNDFTVSIRSVPKNNGILLDTLCIERSGEKTSPAIYLNDYYEAYMADMPLPDILNNIMEAYHSSSLPDRLTPELFLTMESVKDKIIFRLVSQSANQKLLEEIPHLNLPGLDLSIIFCLFFEENNNGLYSALIHNNQLKTWNLTLKDLTALAWHNTPSIFPPRIRALSDVVRDMAKESLGENYDEEIIDHILCENQSMVPLYLLTNTSSIYGASCICYDHIIKDFAARMEADLIILPSSIHEVLITPYQKDLSFDELGDMVSRINQEEVPAEDQLSNHLYYYSRKDNRLSILLTSSVPVGTKNP